MPRSRAPVGDEQEVGVAVEHQDQCLGRRVAEADRGGASVSTSHRGRAGDSPSTRTRCRRTASVTSPRCRRRAGRRRARQSALGHQPGDVGDRVGDVDDQRLGDAARRPGCRSGSTSGATATAAMLGEELRTRVGTRRRQRGRPGMPGDRAAVAAAPPAGPTDRSVSMAEKPKIPPGPSRSSRRSRCAGRQSFQSTDPALEDARRPRRSDP